MFDMVEAVKACETLADPAAPPIMRLRAAVQLGRIAEAAEAQVVAGMAAADGWDREDEAFTYAEAMEGRRLVRVGADGVLLDEALPLEIACAKHTSVGAATNLIRDIVDLNTRHPHTWAAVLELKAPVWRARQVAQACGRYEFTHEQAVAIDKRIAPAWDKIGWRRFSNVLKAAVMVEAPEVARRRAEESAQDRWCRKYDTEDPGSSFISARIDTADAVFLDATVDRLADLLGEQGDGRPKDHRRAVALGVLATPAVALSMLGVHTRRSPDPGQDPPDISQQVAATALPASQVYVHLHADTLAAGQGVARVEGLGPVLVSQLGRVLGDSRIRLTPVVHMDTAEPVIDAYETPDRIRRHVTLRDVFEVFPYSSRNARRLDLDHTVPYREGRPRQTRPSNLGPLSRKVHRAKTHCNWQLTQPKPGVFCWRTELGQTFTVGPNGITDTTGAPNTS